MADYVRIARAALADMSVETRSGGAVESPSIADSPEIRTGPDRAELERASNVLNRTGVRILALEGGTTIGVWSDLDGPEVRAALRTVRLDRLPIRYLDGEGIPIRYSARRVEGKLA